MSSQANWNFPWSYNDFESDFRNEKEKLENGHHSHLSLVKSNKDGISLYLFDDDNFHNVLWNGHRQVSVIYDENSGGITPIRWNDGHGVDPHASLRDLELEGVPFGTNIRHNHEEIIQITDENREFAAETFGISPTTKYLLISSITSYTRWMQDAKYFYEVDENGTLMHDSHDGSRSYRFPDHSASDSQLTLLRGETPTFVETIEDSGDTHLLKDEKGNLWTRDLNNNLSPLTIRTLNEYAMVSDFDHITRDKVGRTEQVIGADVINGRNFIAVRTEDTSSIQIHQLDSNWTFNQSTEYDDVSGGNSITWTSSGPEIEFDEHAIEQVQSSWDTSKYALGWTKKLGPFSEGVANFEGNDFFAQDLNEDGVIGTVDSLTSGGQFFGQFTPAAASAFILPTSHSLDAAMQATLLEANPITEVVMGQVNQLDTVAGPLIAAGPLDAVTVDEPRNNDF